MKILGKTAARILLVLLGVLVMSGCKDGNVRDSGNPGGGSGGHSHYSDGGAGGTR